MNDKEYLIRKFDEKREEYAYKPKNYENRVICFLDILGFSKTVNISSNNDKTLRSILRAIEYFYIYKYNKEVMRETLPSSLQISQFSDSIVISYLIDDNIIFSDFIREIKYSFIYTLVREGMLVRGSITYGKLIHDNSLLVGPALIEAYNLEVNIAKYPRIIVTNKLLDSILSNTNNLYDKEYEEKFFQEHIKKDNDNIFFIDIFNSMLHIVDDEFLFYLQDLYKIILEGLKSENKNIKSKYLWMREKYNSMDENEKIP